MWSDAWVHVSGATIDLTSTRPNYANWVTNVSFLKSLLPVDFDHKINPFIPQFDM